MWDNFKGKVHHSVECFVSHKLLKIRCDYEYYNEDIKRLKTKVTKAHNKRKLGVPHTDKLKQLSKRMLAANKQVQETYINSILSRGKMLV
jgi:hypothetical protein